MATTTPTPENRIDAEPTPATDIDPRTRRAVTGNMVVVPEGDASGLFDVYSATDGENEIYTVDLRTKTCACADYEYRKPAGGCKHERRIKLALGIMDLPSDPTVEVEVEVDSVLANSREKYGASVPSAATEPSEQEDVLGEESANPVSDAHTPASTAEAAAPHAVATDGGVVVPSDALESPTEAEPETEAEIETVEELIVRVDREAGRLPVAARVAVHAAVIDGYHWSLGDFPDSDVYSAAIDCATDTARALARTELELEGDR